MKVCDSSLLGPQQEDEDGGPGRGRLEKVAKHFQRAGLGKEPRCDGEMVAKAQAERLSQNNETPGHQNFSTEMGQAV